MSGRLPIDDVLPDIDKALADTNRLVIAAPPGAGKTTRVPLWLMDAPWRGRRKFLLIEPRRIAARMAATRMAAMLGEKVGGRVGLSTRVDRRISKETIVEVVTDGLFTRRILSDPELKDVAAVFFDEFHERGLNADLGLALAVEAQGALRDDLRLIVMSATLDVAKVAGAMGATAIESEGRAFPVETIYMGDDGAPLEAQVARAVRRALGATTGSVLVFLPGQREIMRTAEALVDLPSDIIVAPLYGALSPAEQDRAVAPAPAGKRKVVIATDIAESALTIEGVDAVVDAGLARVAEFDPSSGATRLVTRKAARANVDQRRGRAGRLSDGVCFRLWDEEATRGLAASPAPEITTGDLSSLALALAEWGARDAATLMFLDPPPKGRLDAAYKELRDLGAIDASGALTETGRRMAALPMGPRQAAMIARADEPGERALAAEIAALLSERGLGGQGVDLAERAARFRRDRSGRAETLRAQAARWANVKSPAAPPDMAGVVVARAFPHRIARAKGSAAQGQRQYLTAGGGQCFLAADDPLATHDWLAVADTVGAANNARIVAAAALSEAAALAIGGVEETESAAFDRASGRVRASRVKRLGAIRLAETPLPAPSAAVMGEALVAAVRAHGFDLLKHGEAIAALQAKAGLIAGRIDALPDISDASLMARLDDWLLPALGVPPSLDRPSAADLSDAIAGAFGWQAFEELKRLAPDFLELPSGRRARIDYRAEGGPLVEVRAQELFGMVQHPTTGGGLPLTLSLLSPAGREIARTRDIAGFWRGGYLDMAKDMRARYPKHDWPADPAKARPHEGKTKARLARDA